MNLRGSIDLLKLNNVFAGKIKSSKNPNEKVDVVIIPVKDNDIFQVFDETTGKVTRSYLKISALERREVGPRGDTHYIKAGISNNFKEQCPELAERLKKEYLGDMSPFTFEAANAASTQVADVQMAEPNNDLPF